MASLVQVFNRLLPFATPGTPLLQDLVHLAAVCALLYFAPQLQERLRRRDNAEAEGSLAPLDDSTLDEVGQDRDNLNIDEDVPLPAGDEEEDDAADLPDDIDDEGDHNDDPTEGQAGPAQRPDLPAARDVGAKKARSIARRDQRRAYHEFQRSQGEAQRALDAEGAKEREAALTAERERRKAVEAAIEVKKVKDREERREKDRRDRAAEMQRRDSAVEIVKEALRAGSACDLWKVAEVVGGDADADWVERLLKATGFLGMKDGVLTTVTAKGWVVRVGADDMKNVYTMAIQQDAGNHDGEVSYDVLGGLLEKVLRVK